MTEEPFDQIIVHEDAAMRLRDRVTGLSQHSPLGVRVTTSRFLAPEQAVLLCQGRVVGVLDLRRS